MAFNTLLYSTMGLVAGGYLFYKGFSWFRVKRLIQNTPTSKVRSIAIGIVELYGKVLLEKNKLLSPLENKACVYYNYTIEEYRSDGKRSYWVTVKQGHDSIPFKLKDDTGSVLVNPEYADIHIPVDFEFRSGMGRDPPRGVISLLKSENLAFENFLGINKTMRYREYRLEPDDKVYILGNAQINTNRKEATAQKNEENLIITKSLTHPFLIFDSPEETVLNSYRWKSLGGIIGGAALLIFCFAIILKYFGLL